MQSDERKNAYNKTIWQGYHLDLKKRYRAVRKIKKLKRVKHHLSDFTRNVSINFSKQKRPQLKIQN